MKQDLISLKKAIDNLSEAYDLIKQSDEELPEEYKFLLDPEFEEKLNSVKGDAERILLTTQTVGEEIGPENVTADTVEETVRYLEDIGMLEAKEEEADDKEKDTEEADVSESPEDAGEEKPNVRESKPKPKTDDKEKEHKEKFKKYKKKSMKIIEQLLDLD